MVLKLFVDTVNAIRDTASQIRADLNQRTLTAQQDASNWAPPASTYMPTYTPPAPTYADPMLSNFADTFVSQPTGPLQLPSGGGFFGNVFSGVGNVVNSAVQQFTPPAPTYIPSTGPGGWPTDFLARTSRFIETPEPVTVGSTVPDLMANRQFAGPISPVPSGNILGNAIQTAWQAPAEIVQGAILAPFGDLQYNPATGQLERHYDWGSVMGGFREFGQEAATLGLSGIAENRIQQENALYDQYGIDTGGGLFNIPGAIGTLRMQGQEFQASPDVPTGVKFAANVALDPLNYIGTGAAKKLLGPLDTMPVVGPVARNLIDTPTAGLNFGAAIGGGLAAQAADSFDLPGNPNLYGLGGAVLGAGVAANPGLAARAYTSTLGPEGSVVRAVERVAPGFGGSVIDDAGASLPGKATRAQQAAIEKFIEGRAGVDVFYADNRPYFRSGDGAPLAQVGEVVDTPIGRGRVVDVRSTGTERGVTVSITEPLPSSPIRRGYEITMRATLDDLPNPEFRAATDAILEGVRRESNIRRVGIAQREISEGRVRQASGIMDEIAAGRAAGLSGEELAARARSGAATGPLRQTFTEPIPLTPTQRNAVLDELTNMVERGELRQFEYLTAVKATQKLINGEGLQPAEIRLLRNVFGEEVASAVADRPMSAAQLRRQEMREIQKGRELEARLAERRQREAIQKLQRENRRAAILQERKDTRELRARAADAERAAREGTAAPIRSGADLARVNDIKAAALKAVNDADELEIRQGRRIQAEVQERAQRQAAREEVSANRAAFREQVRQDSRIPNTEQVLAKAEKLIGEEWPANQALRQEGIRTIRQWVEGNEVLLNTISKQSEDELLGGLRATIRGDAPNSFVTALLHRQALLETALQQQGFDPDIAHRVARILADRELQARYGDAVPPHVADMLRQARQPSSRAVEGAADMVQTIKNTMFGLDFGVFGVQVHTALNRGGVPALIGLINKTAATLHLPHVNTLYADVNLPKMVQYQLDGVAQNAMTGVADYTARGTVIGSLGKPGRVIDRPIAFTLEKLTDLQFRNIMTPIRNTIYEGNLVLAHLARQDITDARVRATAADAANTATSAGKLSPVRGRAAQERALLLSPSMTRSQIQYITSVARVFSPKATPMERLVGATAIASWAASHMLLAKVLSDWFDIDLEWDQSVPGAGNVLTPIKDKDGRNIIVNVFPQEQVQRAVLRSLRYLSEEEYGKAGEEWAKLAIGRSSPVLQILGKAAGIGFEAGEGYRLGDYGSGSDFKSRLLNLAPLPPIIAAGLQEGWDAASLGFDLFGIGNYPEEPYWARDRQIEADPRFGKPFSELDRGQQREAIEAYGDVEFERPEYDNETRADIGFEALERSNAQLEAELGQRLGANWQPSREVRTAIGDMKEKRALAWDVAIGPDLEAWLAANRDDPESLRDFYGAKYYAVEMPTLPNGEPDFDTFYRQRDAVLQEAAAAGVDTGYITRRDGTGYLNERFTDPVVRTAVAELEETQAMIRESGYWDLRERAWDELNAQAAAPGYQPGMSFDEYKQMVIQEAIAGGVPAFDAEEVAMSRHPVLKKFGDAYKRLYFYPWVDQHPEETWALVQWEYLNPDEKVERFLISQGLGR